MKPVTEKESFFAYLTVCKKTHHTSVFPLFSVILAVFLFFSLSSFSEVRATNFSVAQQPTSAKTKAKPVKKGKAKTKGRKPNAIRKDTLSDIDPANTSSPLYQKTNNR